MTRNSSPFDPDKLPLYEPDHNYLFILKDL